MYISPHISSIIINAYELNSNNYDILEDRPDFWIGHLMLKRDKITEGIYIPYFELIIEQNITTIIQAKVTIRLEIRKIFSPHVIYKNIGIANFFSPYHSYRVIELNLPWRWGIFRCYFEVDPENNYAESNEKNNKLWAYFLLTGFSFMGPGQLGDLKPY